MKLLAGRRPLAAVLVTLVALVLLVGVGPVVAPALSVPLGAGVSAWLLPVSAVALRLALPVGVVLLLGSLLARRGR
jgi:hypothetical protein